MDFVELDAIEGLRWSWNSWPVSKPESNDLVIPLSIMQTPLMNFNDLPLLPYDPLICSRCNSVLNPYARVDYPSRIWICPFCYQKNSFPRSYAEIGENNIPAELFPTYSTVEYQLGYQLGQNLRINSNPIHNWGTGTVTGSGTGNGLVKSNSSSFSSSSLSSLDQRGVGVRGFGTGPVFVFVVDCSSSEDELRSLKNELLLIVAQLPENAIVGLIVFDSVVRVYDLGFTECLRVVVFHGERKLSSSQIIDHLGIHPAKLGKTQGVQKHSFILPVSECEFIITTAIEDIHHSLPLAPGHRAPRCTGVAIQVAVALLEGSALHTGSRVMVFTSGPATMGSGMVVSHDLNHSIRTHRDVNSGHAPFYWKSREFYKQLSGKLMDSSVVLDLFACSLDQIGVTEMRDLVEKSGGFIMMAESFESDQFKKCLRHIFRRDENGFLNMCFDVSIEIITTKDVKIRGAIGPCVSLRKKTASVSENEVGEGGTTTWKLGTVTDKTCIAFFFEVSQDQKPHPGTAFFIQFITKYRHGNMGIRKRVTSAARRWVSGGAEIASGFDQETAAAVMARLAVHETEKNFPREVVRWLDKELIRFASKFGDYIPEDPSSFRLSTNFSLYPQFMYHLRRSQFIDVFNSSPDETAFFQVMLNREGVIGSLLMIQPSLSRYSFDGPPVPVLLDVCSLSPDVILLFDSYFYVVIHYGSKIAQWKKMGYDRDPNHESFRKLLEAPEVEAEQVVGQRIPVPKLVKCDQHSSQARFLLAKLNPSATHKSGYVDGSEVIMTDDVSLQVFIEHLQELAVQG